MAQGLHPGNMAAPRRGHPFQALFSRTGDHGAMVNAVSTSDRISQIVSRSKTHEEVARLQERVDVWTRQYESDLKAEKALAARLAKARPGLETRGAELAKWQKVRRALPTVGMATACLAAPLLGVATVTASPLLLGLAMVGALGVGGSMLGIEKLKAWLPEQIDTYNAKVERFNRQSAEQEGLQEETRKSRLTLEAAKEQLALKKREEETLLEETSRMVDAATGRTAEGAPGIIEDDHSVVIGNIRLPKLS